MSVSDRVHGVAHHYGLQMSMVCGGVNGPDTPYWASHMAKRAQDVAMNVCTRCCLMLAAATGVAAGLAAGLQVGGSLAALWESHTYWLSSCI